MLRIIKKKIYKFFFFNNNATGSVCFHRIGFTSSLTLSPEYFAIFLHSTCSLSDS